MSFETTLTVLGGDLRQAAVASHLTASYRVLTWAVPHRHLSPLVIEQEDWRAAVEAADILVLPLPASPDSKHVYAPFCEEIQQKPPEIGAVLDLAPRGVLVAGGRLSHGVRELLTARGISYFDYFEDESLQQKNAIPTAEGAVEILMREIPRTVSGLSVGITGFGRVGQALARLLIAMGAKVTVAVRRLEAVPEASAMGCEALLLENPLSLVALGGVDAVFNTVPQRIFTKEVLKALPEELLLVDLASTPGGFEGAALAALGRRVIFALSLPGKYAPLTAGEIIADTILKKIGQGGRV
ncbi:MAG: dipicolinate synthase [Ruminococcaceae bacterium]|nr:dipicolinate synthase [Oscillospiraceae bacterium]